MDATSNNRRALAETIIPAGSPLGQSLKKKYLKEDEQLAADEANNLVMQRGQAVLPEEAEAFTNPKIPQAIPSQEAEVEFVEQGQAQPNRQIAGQSPGVQIPVVPSVQAPVVPVVDDSIFGQVEQKVDQVDAKLMEIENQKQQAIAKIQEDEERVDKIDPRGFFTGKSTWQKIVGGVGLFLGSITPEGARNVANIIDKEIERDIEAQKMNIKLRRDKEDKDYQRLLQKYGSQEAALLAKKKTAYDLLGVHVKKLELNARNAETRARLSQGAQELDMKRQALGIQLMSAMTKQSEMSSKSSIPGYNGPPLDPATKREFANTIASAGTIKSSLTELKSLISGTGEAVPFTKKNDRAIQLVGDIQLQLKEIKKLGVLSGDDAKRLDYYISNPSIFKTDSRSLAEIDGIFKLVNASVDSQAKSLGLQKSGVSGARKM